MSPVAILARKVSFTEKEELIRNSSIDIYEMPSPEDAFGIYSLHVLKCQRPDTLGCVNCLSPYQLQTVVGSKYVSVVFPSGTEAARRMVDELIFLYLPREGKGSPGFPEILRERSPYSGSLKYLRGPLSISTVSSFLTDLMKDLPYTGIWFISEKGSDAYQALINFTDKEALKKLKGKITLSEMIKEEEFSLFIKGREKEVEEEHGDFGF